jgi:hypothetical protein
MAVHPTSHDVYRFVSFGAGNSALIKVSPAGVLSRVDLASAKPTIWALPDAPAVDQYFRDRTGDWPVPAGSQYRLKAMTSPTSGH